MCSNTFKLSKEKTELLIISRKGTLQDAKVSAGCNLILPVGQGRTMGVTFDHPSAFSRVACLDNLTTVNPISSRITHSTFKCGTRDSFRLLMRRQGIKIVISSAESDYVRKYHTLNLSFMFMKAYIISVCNTVQYHLRIRLAWSGTTQRTSLLHTWCTVWSRLGHNKPNSCWRIYAMPVSNGCSIMRGLHCYTLLQIRPHPTNPADLLLAICRSRHWVQLYLNINSDVHLGYSQTSFDVSVGTTCTLCSGYKNLRSAD